MSCYDPGCDAAPVHFYAALSVGSNGSMNGAPHASHNVGVACSEGIPEYHHRDLRHFSGGRAGAANVVAVPTQLGVVSP